MIQVLKADRSVEPFDERKLAAAIWRAMEPEGESIDYARGLAEGIGAYIRHKGMRRVSSSAVLEMTLRALLYVGFPEAAKAAEAHHDWRSVMRRGLRIEHDSGAITLWDKGWLCELASCSWNVSRQTARILAGKVELELFARAEPAVSRQQVQDTLNEMVSQYGLADAVPARL
jgi:hypothetical protein